MAMMEIASGAVLNDTYELIDLLGQGGMGEVWRGRHRRLPKEVAIKILTPSAQSSAEAVARFEREAKISTQLGHPNIVEILDFDTLTDGRAYIVMELLVGEDLRHRLRRGPLPTKEALEILNQVAAALLVAHRAGVVHRDLKPENIFLFRKQGVLSSELCVKVLDFGISKIQGSQTLVTRDHDVLGTPAYMSPEQATGKNREVDGHTDQFALATIGYELFSGKCAFAGDNLAEVVHKVVYEEVPPLAQLKPELPLHITSSIDKGMAKAPGQRFSDVSAFIRQITASDAVREHPTGPDPEGRTGIASPDDPSKLPTGSGEAKGAVQHATAAAATPGMESTLAPSNLALAPSGPRVTPGLESTLASSSGLETTLAPWETGPAAMREPQYPTGSPPPRAVPTASEETLPGQGGIGDPGPEQPAPLVAPMASVAPSVPMASVAPAASMASAAPSEARRSGALVALVLGLAALAVLALLVVRMTRTEQRVEHRVSKVSSARPMATDLSTSALLARVSPDAAAHGSQQDASPPRPDRSAPRARPRPKTSNKTSLRRRPPRPELSSEVAELLRQAHAALKRENFRRVLRLANRALSKQKNQHEANVLMAQAHCGLRDIGMVQAMLRRVPRAYHGRVWRFCGRFGIQAP